MNYITYKNIQTLLIELSILSLGICAFLALANAAANRTFCPGSEPPTYRVE